MKIQVVFYSMYGHVHRMAEAVVAGAREVSGAEVSLYQVAELAPEAALERTGAKEARAAFAQVPLAQPQQLVDADAIIFGTPTRFGNMAAQMRNFLDQTGAKLPYFVNPSVDFKLAMTALALLVAVGVLAGLMPAVRAAKITPTEAMKAE